MAAPTANTWYRPPTLSGPGKVRDGRTEVGVIAPSYGMEHLSYIMDLPAYRHVVLRRLPLHRFERNSTFWDKTPVLVHAPVPLVHTFNHLPMNGPPFVVSFELELPFYLHRHRDWQHRIGHRLLASPRCRAILSLSDTAGDLARRKFTALGRPEIAAKIQTFRGAVLPSWQEGRQDGDRTDGPLRLLFVGADGLRKGIVPLLDAVADLRRSGAEIELTVVSAMLDHTYAVVAPEPTAAALCRTMAETPWITHHRSLPYEAVRAAMATHDLLLFPTLDETLGWVVIEAAMEGMATVSSNVFALPELVEDGVTGRVIDLPLNEGRRWTGIFAPDRPAALAEAYDRLRTGLVAALGAALNDRSLARRWGDGARARLARLYDPAAAAPVLANHYARAIGGAAGARA
jgi:glycosyltransferase involved in cell wall biosynthesis